MLLTARLSLLFLALQLLSKCTAFASHERSGVGRSASSFSLRAKEDFDELPSDFPRRDDVLVALAAVRKACHVTERLQPESSTEEGISTVSKTDLSPVTVADFAAQALVLNYLHQAFPKDSFIAEESSASLVQDESLAQQVLTATSLDSLDLVKTSIDLGKEYEGWDDDMNPRPPRVWCLDPIDGTKGFLRGRRDGGQYCVALALLENGIPTIGVLGCPNLPANPDDFTYRWNDDEDVDNNQDSRGCIFVASRDGGCYQLPYRPGKPAVKLQVTDTMQPSLGRFCIGVEKFSDALGQCAGMAKILHGPEGVKDGGDIVLARRIDSQAKYGVIARAGAEYYVRLPKPGYVEWIWDHAAGNVVLTEAGGTMTDTRGDPIDFSLGAKLSDKVKGVL